MSSNQYESAAIQALMAWHAVAASKFPNNMKMSFDEFYRYVQLSPAFVLNFGKSVISAASISGVGMSGVLSSMEELARQSQGRVSQYSDGYPRLAEFFDTLAGRALSWDVKRIVAVSGDIAKEGVEKVATIGALALGGYGLFLAIGAAIGLYVTFSSFRRRT